MTTHALSVLLNFARLTRIRAFPRRASFRTSVPICSPSLSQSVQINRALDRAACSSMFRATAFLSCAGVSGRSDAERHSSVTYMGHRFLYWSLKQSSRRTGCPSPIITFKVEGCQVADNAGHGDRTGAPRVPEVEVKEIVLDIWTSTNRDLHLLAQCISLDSQEFYTYCLKGSS